MPLTKTGKSRDLNLKFGKLKLLHQCLKIYSNNCYRNELLPNSLNNKNFSISQDKRNHRVQSWKMNL